MPILNTPHLRQPDHAEVPRIAIVAPTPAAAAACAKALTLHRTARLALARGRLEEPEEPAVRIAGCWGRGGIAEWHVGGGVGR